MVIFISPRPPLSLPPILCGSLEVDDDSALTLPNVTGPDSGPRYGGPEKRRPVRSSPGLSAGSPWLSPLGAEGHEPPVTWGFLHLQTCFRIRGLRGRHEADAGGTQRRCLSRRQLGRQLMAAPSSHQAESAQRRCCQVAAGQCPRRPGAWDARGLPLLPFCPRGFLKIEAPGPRVFQ